MEREILFRGKGEFTGKWIEGYYGKVGEKGYIFTGKVVANNHMNDYGSTCFGLERYAVDPATVGQYTGMKDTNGKKIFEGDIVEILPEGGEHAVIRWSLDEAMFTIFADGWYADFDNFRGRDLKVIGNRWDNPELLEVKK